MALDLAHSTNSVGVMIPDEILAMIAEACVEPYHIYIESSRVAPNRGLHTLKVIRSQSTNHLVSICVAFGIRLKRGLRRCFDGRMRFPGMYVEDLESVFRRQDLAWMIPKITSIMLTYEQFLKPCDIYLIRSFPVLNDPYLTFANLKFLDICCAIIPTSPENLSTDARESEKEYLEKCEFQLASRVRHLVDPPNQAVLRLIVKFILKDNGNAPDTDTYTNTEVRFVNGSEKFARTYQTNVLDWVIRHRVDEDDAETIDDIISPVFGSPASLNINPASLLINPVSDYSADSDRDEEQ